MIDIIYLNTNELWFILIGIFCIILGSGLYVNYNNKEKETKFQLLINELYEGNFSRKNDIYNYDILLSNTNLKLELENDNPDLSIIRQQLSTYYKNSQTLLNNQLTILTYNKLVFILIIFGCIICFIGIYYIFTY